MPEEAPEGIDRAASWPGSPKTWQMSRCAALRISERISGGRSNLTYSVTDAAGGRWALRRPPLGKGLTSAHDVGREHKVMSALAPTAVQVPPTVGMCEDATVNGAPFFVMDFVEGPVLRTQAAAVESFEEGDRHEIGERVADTLVRIHEIDPDEVGIGDLGRKAGTTSRASSTAGTASGRVEDPRRAADRRRPRRLVASPTRARRRSSTATTGSTT